MISPSWVAYVNMPRAFIESGATCPYFIVRSCIGRGNISKYKKNRVYRTYSLVDPALFKSDLFEFNRPRRFRGQIVEHAVHALHLVHDAVHDGLEHRKRNLRALGGHEIVRLHGAERNGVVVGAEIAHYADGAEVRECGKVLAELTRKACFLNLLAVDAVCLLDYLNLLRRDFADDADAESRPREGLAVHKRLGKAEF